MRRFFLALLASAPALLAQAPALVLPAPSPRAHVEQQVGLTEIQVTYSRPAIKGRKVWGGIVPYGAVWRAGANENTVVAFSTPVRVGDAVLPAGRYGLHMIPTPTEWTVIFSSQSQAWGSYSYDPKEDAVRLKVKPEPAEPTERLAYTFDDPTEDAVTLSLRWEKLRIPVPLQVDTKQVVVGSLRGQLRGFPRFFPEGWNGAAAWCVAHDVNLEEAQTWNDRSLAMRESFAALRTKETLLAKKGDSAGAEAARAKAMAVATEAEVNQLGYALLGQNKAQEALAVFQKNVKDHPGSWNTYDSLAEAYAVLGDKAQAISCYQKALEMVNLEAQRVRIRGELAKLK